jgi:hypothetical protein
VWWYLKGGIVEPKETAVSRKQLDEPMSVATDMRETVEELFEAVFSVQSVPRLCSELRRRKSVGHSQNKTK